MGYFKIRFFSRIYEFRLNEDGSLWFKDVIGAWTNVNQRLPIPNVKSAKLFAREMLVSAGY